MPSFHPIKVVTIDLNQPLHGFENLDGYAAIHALIKVQQKPIGQVNVSTINGRITATRLLDAILKEVEQGLLSYSIKNLVHALAENKKLDIETAVSWSQTTPTITKWPLITVAVCTRDRVESLANCLTAIQKLDYPALDILIVDNAPSTHATEKLVREQFPSMRYLCEPLPGLDNARNRAILAARGDIIAYTDDDVIVDANWVQALAEVFVLDEDVTAVTGLVLPLELETESQSLFELYGGFSRGFNRTWNRADHQHAGDTTFRHGGTGKFGTGANMAFRRQFLLDVGGFDPALDVGTVTNGGGDLDMFYRVIKTGHTLVYEPKAIVHHAHRREYNKLHTQITNNGIGFYSFMVRNFIHYPDEREAIFRIGFWWLRWWNFRRLILSFLKPPPIPRALIWTELWGSFKGLFRYQKARRLAAKNEPIIAQNLDYTKMPAITGKPRGATAVLTLDLNAPLQNLEEVAAYRQTTIYVQWQDTVVGKVEICNDYHPISALQLRDGIVSQIGIRLLEECNDISDVPRLWKELMEAIHNKLQLNSKEAVEIETAVFTQSAPVSIVIATFDRPDDLQKCLQSISQQNTSRPVEIIVVDNHADSGKTWPVVSAFPKVTYLVEKRQGLSYARNAGVLASHGDIIIFTDDDVIVEKDWLEKLIVPFAQPEVMVVTGNVLPQKMETEAQRMFEEYGGLGRGFLSKRVDHAWFKAFKFTAVPTWELGATANAAFRATIFHHPEIGLLEEALGAGSPTGCSEDTLLFYQVLRAGYTIVYEPTAHVWHNHRQTHKALRKQLYGYSKGHVAYHITTFLRYRDWRSLFHLFLWLPYGHLWRIAMKLLRWVDYPLRLNALEILGNLAGPFALWHSHRRVRRLGRSYLTEQPKSNLTRATTPHSVNGHTTAAQKMPIDHATD